MVCFALELLGPCVVHDFSVGMEAFDELLSINVPWSQEFPGVRAAVCIGWPKYWSISPSNEYSELISFRIDWFDLLVVQGTLKSVLQHHSSKALILQCSAFFTVLLSHPYMTSGKTIALTIQTFVGKVMSLLFNPCLGLS